MADKAFLSGINNYETIGDLRGCINDVHSMHSLLTERFGFDPGAIRVRKDEEVTKKELLKGWKWLLSGAKPGNRLVFHFSGHGSYTADLDEDDPDYADELLCLHAMSWDNPGSYLLDDELRKWTTEIPEGVSVTFILDCCHSGTGTRMVPPPRSRGAKADVLQASSLVDIESSEKRLQHASEQSRSLSQRDRGAILRNLIPESADDLSEVNVLARFAPPPAEIEERVRKAKQRRSFREVVRSAQDGRRDTGEAAMNHVLWAGCRDDQTSADAYIGGDYHGAFTYYFCDTIRAESGEPDSQRVIERLRTVLGESGFSQIPQLEPKEAATIIFNHGKTLDVSTPSEMDMETTQAGGTTLASGDVTALIGVLQQIAELLAQDKRGRDATVISSKSRGLVSVHGICVHPPKFSDPWWKAISPHLTSGMREALGSNRQEVLWSRHVSAIDRAVSPVESAEQREIEQQLRIVLRERAVREVSSEIARSAAEPSSMAMASGVRAVQPVGPLPRAVLGIPGLDCVDDFAKYLVNDRIRSAVLGEFSSVVRPMLARGESIELISHSWGSVVAFEGLRQLEAEGLPGRVHTWFTVGAALSIAYVADRLRPRDGRKPVMVDRWVNLDARADVVGGSLQAVGMGVDLEYLELDPVGCRGFGPFISPACSHSSYFNPDNLVVNRDIFAAAMCR